MTVPSTSQLVADALRELAEAEREWRARGQYQEEYERLHLAEERLRELARALFPAKRHRAKGHH